MADAAERWFPTAVAGDVRPQVLCLPHAGAGAGAYRGWAAGLGPELAVLAVQLPGREQRFGEPPLTGAAEIVERLTGPALDLLREPYLLFGHSMGALLAYELAHALSWHGREPAGLVVSGHAAPQLGRLRPAVHDLPDDALVAHLRMLSPAGAAVLDEPELRELLLPVMRADFTVCDTYTHPARPPLRTPIMVLAGDADPTVPAGSLAPWRELTTGATAVHDFPGGHFYLDDHLDRVLGLVAAGLPRSARR